MPIREEAGLKVLFDAPDNYAAAALIALGRPVHQPRRLTRAAVEDFTTVDSVSGAPFQQR
jgi:hypothetical protein